MGQPDIMPPQIPAFLAGRGQAEPVVLAGMGVLVALAENMGVVVVVVAPH
jgi:hypothetical protein